MAGRVEAYLHRDERLSSGSWWIDQDRVSFGARWREEAPRLARIPTRLYRGPVWDDAERDTWPLVVTRRRPWLWERE